MNDVTGLGREFSGGARGDAIGLGHVIGFEPAKKGHQLATGDIGQRGIVRQEQPELAEGVQIVVDGVRTAACGLLGQDMPSQA